VLKALDEAWRGVLDETDLQAVLAEAVSQPAWDRNTPGFVFDVVPEGERAQFAGDVLAELVLNDVIKRARNGGWRRSPAEKEKE
jgi:hypothetical protein